MGVSFEWIWGLVLLLPLGIYLWWRCRQHPSARDRLLDGVRTILCLCLIFSCAGATLRLPFGERNILVLADVSESAALDGENEASFLAGIFSQTRKEEVGFATFDGSVRAVDPDGVEDGKKQTAVSPGQTNLERAFLSGMALLPSDGQKKLVLVSDGLETEGDAMEAARVLASMDVMVDAYALSPALDDEVQLVELSAPSQVEEGTSFSLCATTYAVRQTKGTLRLYRGNTLLSRQEVTFPAGYGRFYYTEENVSGSGLLYRAEIEPAADHWYQNNIAYAFSSVEDRPSVLLIEEEDRGRELSSLLSSSGVQVDRMTAQNAPLQAEGLYSYDAVILTDVPKNSLPAGFLTALEQYVRVMGGGLVVTGGAHSYALGGYTGTVLEDMLPVSMDLKTQGEEPDLAIIMVIDHSGSMASNGSGVSPMGMAKEAAARAVEVLQVGDTVGVLAFDDTPTWVVEPTKVGEDVSDITSQIQSIQPAGGTSILPALQEACRAINDVEAKRKHIILLTDGQAEQAGYDAVINAMKQQSITLSTVAVGEQSDTRLLSRLAQSSGGRYYYTDAFTDLPEIFAQETMLAGKEYLQNRTFYPKAVNGSPLLTGVSALPPLDGYVSSTVKPRADLALTSDTEEPVLASWQYGLGTAVAWTSDVNGQWSSGFLSSQEGQQVLENMVSLAMTGHRYGAMEASGSLEQGEGVVQMTFSDGVMDEKVEGVAIDASGQEIPMQLKPISPGCYEGRFPAQEGSYLLQLTLTNAQGETTLLRSGVAFSYSREYDLTRWDQGRETLQRIVSLTGGQMVEKPEDVFRAMNTAAHSQKALWPVLTILAAVLLVVLVALERLPGLAERIVVLWPKRKEARSQLPSSPKQNKPAVSAELTKEGPVPSKLGQSAASSEPAQGTASTLLQKKKRRSGK